MRLILVRHAKAAPGDPDASRPLAPEGQEQAAALAEQLGAAQPDAVISSPLLRAVQTATPIAEAAGVELQVDERLAPGATVELVQAVIRGQGDTVVVVGHVPDVETVLLALTGRMVRFRTAGVEQVDL